MGAYVAVAFGSIVFVALLIILSLATINKGYGYKHTVDPHPDEEKETKAKQN